VLKIDSKYLSANLDKMDVAASVYGLALKDVAQFYKEQIDGHMRLCPTMTADEYAEYSKKRLTRDLKAACRTKRIELNAAIAARDCVEIPVIRKELRLAVARSKAYKEYLTHLI